MIARVHEMPSILYIAGSFPARSETFVYREVRELRMRGSTVHCASLNEPSERGLEQFIDLERDLTVVYDGGWITDGLLELLTHPLRSFATLSRAKIDAITPGEKMRLGERLKLPFQALAALALARRLRARGIKHIHCHFAHSPTSVGMYAAIQLGIPFSFTGHANDLFQRRALLRRKLERAAFVACISQWHRELYRTVYPHQDDRYVVIRCGVDVRTWQPKTLSPEKLDALRLLSVCRLVDKKGVDMLIRALAQLRQREGRSIKLTVAGDGPAREKLQSLAREMNCSDAIEWLGAVDNDRVPELLRQADVFALPCRTDDSGDRDGIPVVLMEAMACGVPVISGDLPAIRELIEHDVSDLLVDGNVINAVVAALAKLMDDAAARNRMAAAGRARVESEFALDTNVSRLEQCLQQRKAVTAIKPQPLSKVASV